jgi:hypothetical protein
MSEVRRSAALAASAAEVWSLIGGFNDVPDWHPGAAGSRLEEVGGETRRVIALKGGGTLVERLVAHDADAMSCTYAIVDGPLPVTGYQSTLSVRPAGSGCEVHWSGTFEPAGVAEDKAKEIVASIYDAGLGALVKRFG